MEFDWGQKKLPEFRCTLPQTASICAPQFFQNPEWTLWTLYVCLVIMEFDWGKKKLPEFRCTLPQTACG
jgi:hypothetical protein